MNNFIIEEKISPHKKFQKDFAIINTCSLKRTFVGTYEEFLKEDTSKNDKYPKEGCVYFICSKDINNIKDQYNKLPQPSIKHMPKINKRRCNDSANDVLYIGKSLDQSIKSRIQNHFHNDVNSTTWGLKLGVIDPDKKYEIKISIYIIEYENSETIQSNLKNALAYFELCMHDHYCPLFGRK